MTVVAEKPEVERRREVCSRCEQRVRDGRMPCWTCARCGCPIVTKTLLRHSTCPENRW